jgi:hypothetical protein
MTLKLTDSPLDSAEASPVEAGQVEGRPASNLSQPPLPAAAIAPVLNA